MTALVWLAAELPRLGELQSNRATKRENRLLPSQGLWKGRARHLWLNLGLFGEGAEIRVGMEEFCPAFPLCLNG